MKKKDLNDYAIKVFQYQEIGGFLKMDHRFIDQEVLLYFNITGKQSMKHLYEKVSLSYDKIIHLVENIVESIERTYEYMLSENDIMLSPEYIFLDLNHDMPALCYLSGFDKDIRNQMSVFLEYIMNKVDYQDEKAVLLIYNLYAKSKEESYTFDQLRKILYRRIDNSQYPQGHKPKVEDLLTKQEDKPIEEKKTPSEQIKYPVMMEKLEGEKEIYCFPTKNYLITAGSISIFLILITFLVKAKVVYNSLGTQVDYMKLFILLFISICMELYILNKLWSKKNRITKIVSKNEYVNPQDEEDAITLQDISEMTCGPSDFLCDDKQEEKEELPTEFYATCLLNAREEETAYRLRPSNQNIYQTISVQDFPFFIGKLKMQVDYCIDKEVVSRYHAKITKEKDSFYITDLNSTNGTFLNQDRLEPYCKKELKIGDTIAIANINYIFEHQLSLAYQ